MLGCLLFAARAVIRMTGQAAELRVRLNVVEARLNRINEGLPEKREKVAELTKTVTAMKPLEERLRTYYDALADINIQVEKAQHEAEEQERMKRERKSPTRSSGSS